MPRGFDATVVRNVSQPTLTAFLPDPAASTGSSVIICPGGGFHFLSMASEGIEVARWLASHGVAAFVLKYRLVPTPASTEDFMAQVQRIFVDVPWVRSLSRQYAPLAIADGRQAVTLLRLHAAEWGVATDRIGMLGFSAGGRVTAGVALEHDTASRPDFAAVIYGALWDKLEVPSDAPPLFTLVANDDAVAVADCLDLFAAWRSAEHPAELHVFSEGGHGFGMNQQGLPSDRWIELFERWLRAQRQPVGSTA
jgi:acetyl esterase/lipase